MKVTKEHTTTIGRCISGNISKQIDCKQIQNPKPYSRKHLASTSLQDS